MKIKNLNLKKAALVGSVGFLLVGCGKKQDSYQKSEYAMPIMETNTLDQTILSLPLDNDVNEYEEFLLNLYSDTQLECLYQDATSKIMYSYLQEEPDKKYLEMISEREDLMELHQKYLKAVEDDKDEDIELLFETLRKQIKDASFEDRAMMYPILGACEVNYRDTKYALTEEEIASYGIDDIFEEASSRMSSLKSSLEENTENIKSR